MLGNLIFKRLKISMSKRKYRSLGTVSKNTYKKFICEFYIRLTVHPCKIFTKPGHFDRPANEKIYW